MELIGTVKKLFDTQTFPSGFQKRELVLLTNEQYPQPLKIEFLSERVNLLDPVKEGDQLKVSIDLRGREWQAPDGEIKYFVSINGWRVEKADQNTFNEPEQPKAAPSDMPTAKDDDNVFEDDEDDLPF